MVLEIADYRVFSRIAIDRTDGIAFGSASGMSSFTPRRRDRREALSSVLGAATRVLDQREDVSLMRGAFEAALARVLPVRSVYLREIGSRWCTRSDSVGPESVVVDVPGSDPSTQGLLEVTFDPGCGLGEWDFQLL